MIEMLPLRDKETLDRLNRETGESSVLAYCLYDRGNIDGYVLYDIDFSRKTALLNRVSAPDKPSFDGLVRAVFSSLCDAGIIRAGFGPQVPAEMLEQLGFVQPGERETPPLGTFFQGCGHCC